MINWFNVAIDEDDTPQMYLEPALAFNDVMDELKQKTKEAREASENNERRRTGPKSARKLARKQPKQPKQPKSARKLHKNALKRFTASDKEKVHASMLFGLLLAFCVLTNSLFVAGAVTWYTTSVTTPEQTFSFYTNTVVNSSGVFIQETGKDLTLSILMERQRHDLEMQQNYHKAMNSFATKVVDKAVKHIEGLKNELTKKKV